VSRTRIVLGDALAALIDHRGKTPKKLGGDWAPAGHRVISAINVKDGRVDNNDHHYVSDALYERWMKEPLKAGDVLLTSEAPTGEVAFLDTDEDWCLGQRLFGLRGKPGVLDGRYLFYLLRGGEVRHQLLARSTGTTVSGIRQSELVKVELELPPMDEQREVAATLGALDDKIASNRRAQALGQRLLRSLVDSALDESTGDLGRLDDYCELVKDGVAVGELDPDEPYIGLEHMPRASLFLDEWSNADGLGSNKSRFSTGDVLFGKLRPYFKKVGVAPVAGVCSTDILVLRATRDDVRALVAVVASSDALIDSLSASATGTKMPRASWSDLASWPVPTLSALEQQRLGENTSALMARLSLLTLESRRLAVLRDALLPELLSGRRSVARHPAMIEVGV
jgi:type I restriction enzyme S subunit